MAKSAKSLEQQGSETRILPVKFYVLVELKVRVRDAFDEGVRFSYPKFGKSKQNDSFQEIEHLDECSGTIV